MYTKGVFERPVGLAREKAVIASRLVRTGTAFVRGAYRILFNKIFVPAKIGVFFVF